MDMFKRMFLFIPDHKYSLMVSCQLLESLKELLSPLGSAPWPSFSFTFDHPPGCFWCAFFFSPTEEFQVLQFVPMRVGEKKRR